MPTETTDDTAHQSPVRIPAEPASRAQGLYPYPPGGCALDLDDEFSWVDAQVHRANPPETDELDDAVEDTLRRAAHLEARADQVTGLPLLADGLVAALDQTSPDDLWLAPAHRFAGIVRAAADRAAQAADIARHTTVRLLDLPDDGPVDERHDEVLTIGLHLPIADNLVDDAADDAVPALRHLARLTLAAASHHRPADPDEDAGPGAAHRAHLERLARGTLRQPLPGLHNPTLAAEAPDLWSVTIPELLVELTGLLANLVLDHRSLLILEHTDRDNRYVQALCDHGDLLVESVGSQFLTTDRLTPHDIDQLHELGWEPPGPMGEAPPNWHRLCDAPADVHAAAEQLVHTLLQMHGLTDPTRLALEVGVTVDAS